MSLRCAILFALSLRYARSPWNHRAGQAQAAICPLSVHPRSLGSARARSPAHVFWFRRLCWREDRSHAACQPEAAERQRRLDRLLRDANLADPGIRQDFPSLRLIDLLVGKIPHWRLIPADSATFESEALHACELLLKHDLRFGRVPQSRQARPTKIRRK
jgi:hypothetical protein